MTTRIWNMPWQEFEVALGMRSAFALRNMNCGGPSRAERFLKYCGFDPQDNAQVKQFEQLLGEALFFIRHVLFSSEERETFSVPQEILAIDQPQSLLVMASSTSPRCRYERLWACSLLKVMYTVANIHFGSKLSVLDDAREQIFRRIKDLFVHSDLLIEHDNISVALNRVEWKEAKTRASIILKLLHKSDSTVDEVFDYLGVRFVVEKACEIPLLFKLLVESDVIIPHQVVSVRTRNSILGLKNPKRILQFLSELYSCGTLNEEEFNGMCGRINWQSFTSDETTKRVNLFTSEHYRSLQFTVRHLVRTHNPAFLALESLSNQLRRYSGYDRQEPWIESMIPEQFANYFPIEIQILDVASYEMAKFGPASHEQYKSNQLKAARERVLGGLVRFKGPIPDTGGTYS